MTSSSSTAINAQIDSFPALPATVTNVLAVTSDPESTANDLMQAIIPDQTMCGAILKVANSAFFGIPKGVSTIERAVVVLGYSEIQNIVIGKAIFGSFPKLGRDSKEEVGQFWNHSFTCGLAAKIIAEHFNLNPGEYFVSGLIHDIGKLALLMAFNESYKLQREVEAGESFSNLDLEKEKYGLNHAEAGLRLTQRWMLPDQLCSSAGFHHYPETEEHSPHAIIIQLADFLAILHSTSTVYSPQELDSVVDTYLPQCRPLFEQDKIAIRPDNLHQWYKQITEKRKSDQAILNILSS